MGTGISDRAINILLVDDDKDYYFLTRGLLSDILSGQHRLDWVPTYDEALAIMPRNSYDVYLLDYHLEARTGLDLLREARALGCHAPIIMLTGQGDHDVDLETMQAGAADYLTKGKVDPNTLERSIRYALDREQTLASLLQSREHIAELYEKEQKHNQELDRAYNELRQAEMLRDELTYMIVHDLRNPLTAIQSSLDLYLKISPNSNQVEGPARFIQTAFSASKNMISIIDDLLNVSKLEAGELHPVLVAIDLPKWLSEKQEFFHVQAERRNIKFSIQTNPNLPMLMADVNLIGRVIDNLIGNAFKYTGTGGSIQLTVEQNNEVFMFKVIDDGEGIAPEYHTRIFEKFVQVTDSTGASLRKGTGLGLTLCRLAIEAHGGKIWVESSLGQGSTFIFTLPLRS